MANVLDLRRRIRSVKNTRQITKAMKMVSAAKLRRAQERALAARPYAKMITSVLESLTRRVDIFDEETGNLRHPLFAVRPEKRVLIIVVSGDKGFAALTNSATATDNFIKNTSALCDKYDLDGIDIDWEYTPGSDFYIVYGEGRNTLIELPGALSTQRSNGLFSMVERIRRIAADG